MLGGPWIGGKRVTERRGIAVCRAAISPLGYEDERSEKVFMAVCVMAA